ncbi:carboxylesterase/lipase family protein [Nocardia brevicatena]|uniref:carboxylesterase/lipase family protein n=1 Tax=Nocardia brevicatena TaxID=37327 RepID=UPI0006872F3E|nr:carboxylesterase/lipase family protein [Nocardia brevicatena]
MVASADITTADGVVRGRRGRRIQRWRAIPYATPPVGDLRFRAPQPVRPWTGVRDATEFQSAAIQPRFGGRISPRQTQQMSEDALTLNIVAPASSSSAPRPVMVFVHGGGYIFGTSALTLYSGARLALRGDVIVVSLNYRLGVFGYVDFGEFGTDARPFDSNLGLRDQIAALRWVRRNIAAFGGDPNNVTIFGESAGAHAVLSLLAAPDAAGLFHRAIAQSAPADWGVTLEEAQMFARLCVNFLSSSENAHKALTESDPHDIRRAYQRALRKSAQDHPGFFPTAPVVDGDLLPQLPFDAIIDGNAHRVPLIIGTCRNEGALFARFADALPTDPERLRAVLAASGEEATRRVLDTYFGFPREDVAVQAGGDYTFWRPSVEVMAGHSRHAPTYAYRYDFAPRSLRLAGLGATHATDLIPVFGGGDTSWGRALTAAGGRRGMRSVTYQFQENWLEFARTGAPLSSWPAYTEDRRSTLIIDDPGRVDDDPHRARRLAWEGIRAASPAHRAGGERDEPGSEATEAV